MNNHKPLVLVILDGWGYREATDNNAIAAATTPVWDNLWQHSPHALLEASGHAVGVPEGQMGNSEVGHLHMGAGRFLPQDLVRLNQAIQSGEFSTNPVLVSAIHKAIATDKAIHLIGLLSPGGVHSHEEHLFAVIQLAAALGAKKVYLHAFLDGRDTPPQSALPSIQKAINQFSTLKCGQLASISGRYYAMDRDQRWERTQQVYDLLTSGTAKFHADSGVQALMNAYERGEKDEFVQPTLIGEEQVSLQEGDVLIAMNFRADRLRQLMRALANNDFPGFNRAKRIHLAEIVTLTEYAKDIQATVSYPPLEVKNSLGEYISARHLKQLRIAETEKYAHVTFFFNGGREAPFSNEDRILVPSPKIATYDLQPEMSAPALTSQLCEQIKSNRYDVIICNYANADMVGHSGNFSAAVAAIEEIDRCLGELIHALDEVGGELLITADHGNAEMMFDTVSQQPHTAHTTCLVPFLYRGRPARVKINLGNLSDVAPTLLYLLGLPQPSEMTGCQIFELLN